MSVFIYMFRLQPHTCCSAGDLFVCAACDPAVPGHSFPSLSTRPLLFQDHSIQQDQAAQPVRKRDFIDGMLGLHNMLFSNFVSISLLMQIESGTVV